MLLLSSPPAVGLGDFKGTQITYLGGSKLIFSVLEQMNRPYRSQRDVNVVTYL